MLKLNSFKGSQIITEFAGVDLWRLKEVVSVEVKTSDGTLHYLMKPGFPTDMRSGSHAIDRLIPKFTKNNQYNLAILCHDFAYTKGKDGENLLSRELADILLRDMAVQSGELGSVRAAIMYRSVRMFGASAYECPNTGEYEGAGKFMEFRWGDK
jgi:hypothetical protein